MVTVTAPDCTAAPLRYVGLNVKIWVSVLTREVRETINCGMVMLVTSSVKTCVSAGTFRVVDPWRVTLWTPVAAPGEDCQRYDNTPLESAEPQFGNPGTGFVLLVAVRLGPEGSTTVQVNE